MGSSITTQMIFPCSRELSLLLYSIRLLAFRTRSRRSLGLEAWWKRKSQSKQKISCPTASRNLITSCLERSIKIQQSLIMWLTKENPLFARGFHQMPLSRRLSMPNWILSGECPSSWSKAGSISHSERKYHTLHVRDFANVFSWEIFTLEASRAWNNYIG